MTNMRIILDGDNALPEYRALAQDGKLPHGEIDAAVRLTAGMSSGRSSVGLMIKLDDGRSVFAETSMRLFLAAADAFRAREQADGRES